MLIEAVTAFYKRLIKEHGGSQEIRGPGLLVSAFSGRVTRYNYDPQAVFDLAASYASGLSSNRPFIDENKRIAFPAITMFWGQLVPFRAGQGRSPASDPRPCLRRGG